MHESAAACPHCGLQTDAAKKLDGYASYRDVPWYRKNWCAILCAFLFPIGLILMLITGAIYYERDGQLRKYTMLAKIFLFIWFAVAVLILGSMGSA
jgi:hypothetical protein